MLKGKLIDPRWAIALLFTFSATPLLAQSENTFLISADKCQPGPPTRTLTGFLVIDPTPKISVGIVTALHGVAGCKIKATSDGNILLREYLTVAAVDVVSDSALLSSDELTKMAPKPTGFRVRSEVDWVKMRNSDVAMWGHPAGIPLKDTRLRIRKTGKERLFTYLNGMTEKQRKLLEARKSPDPRLEVVGLDGPILPGDSGAPIIDASGYVVAIANGGLFGGLGGLNWAIPFDAIKWASPATNDDYERIKHQDPGDLFSFELDTQKEVKDLVARGLEPIGNSITLRYTVKIPLTQEGLQGIGAQLQTQMKQLTSASPISSSSDTYAGHFAQPGQPERWLATFNSKSPLMPASEYQRGFLSRPPFSVSLYLKQPQPLPPGGCSNLPPKPDIEFSWDEASTAERTPDNYDETTKWKGITLFYDTTINYLRQSADGIFRIRNNNAHVVSVLNLSRSYIRLFSRTQHAIEFADLTIVIGQRSFVLPKEQLSSDACGIIIYRLPAITPTGSPTK